MGQRRALSSLIRPFLPHFSHRMDIRCFLTDFSVKKMSRLNSNVFLRLAAQVFKRKEGIIMRSEEQAYLEAVDVAYSYRLARRMESFRTNQTLGYRTAGSEAELATGRMLAEEMRSIGLTEVTKDPITLDSWEFEHAELRYQREDGSLCRCRLGAYQTQLDTEGFRRYPLVYLGKGTAADYEGLDVTGKLVLVEINQRDEWWINFPVYQAHLRGAAALIAVQEGGYGEIHEEALNAQDIAGPPEAPAFSMSRADAVPLKRELLRRGEMEAEFSACTRVRRDQRSYNIVGRIPGRNRERMILLSAHYDSYFSGFQDDNAAVAMMLGIARALIKSGYQPQNTLVFCAMAAEEWGLADSKYDWSTGAYEQVFTVHPDWQGRVIADINFELPAHAHDRKDAVRCVYEYRDFLEEVLAGIDVDREAYPDGIQVLCPIQTWSDDFSMAIAGIPSMVNDFSSGSFMETHYHSQFDNESFYQEAVYLWHHRLYGRLLMAFDRTAVAPLSFGRLWEAMEQSLDLEYCRHTKARGLRLANLIEEAKTASLRCYEQVKQVNRRFAALIDSGRQEEAEKLAFSCREWERELLTIFRETQDSFVRLNWHDEVLFPQEAVRANLVSIEAAIDSLKQGDVKKALEAVYQIDNNRYAFLFDEEVFRHFTDYVFNQPKERLKWGAGRIRRHENLFVLVRSLKGKLAGGQKDVAKEIETLERVKASQMASYCDDIEYMIREVEKIVASSAKEWKITSGIPAAIPTR